MAIIFFDFDSTVVSKETLDHAMAHVLKNHPDKERMVREIEEITRLGMEGKMEFKDSVKRRVAAVPLSKAVLEETGNAMLSEITPDLTDVFAWLEKNGHEIFIASGGFIECIQPVARKLGVTDDHVFTNRFVFSQDGRVVGYDEDALLWTNEGKTPVLNAVRAKHPGETIVMIGDGANDLRTFEHKAADIFIGFGAHAVRESVKKKAEYFVHSAPELLEELKKLLG